MAIQWKSSIQISSLKNGFKSWHYIFIVISFVLVLNISPIDSSHQNKLDCICPGIWRPVCSWGVSGNIVIYDNICTARCGQKKNDDGKGILPQLMCTDIASGGNVYRNTSSQEYLDTWLEEMEKEATFYTKVNKLMVQLLKSARGIGGGQEKGCLCPAIHRPVEYFGPSGNIVQFENLCSAECKANSDSDFKIAIFPWRLYERTNSQLGFEEDVTGNYDYYLELWIKDMENEIVFYRRVSSIMRSLDINSAWESSSANTICSNLPATGVLLSIIINIVWMK